jgi:hypothetical protein
VDDTLDNGSITYSLSDDNVSRSYAYASLSLSSDNTSSLLNYDDNNTAASNITFMGNNLFLVTTDNATNDDNITIYQRTNGLGDWSIDNETDITNVEDSSVPSVIQIGADADTLHIVYDNNTTTTEGLGGAVWYDNGTLTQATGHPAISTTQMCSNSEDGKMVVIVDNGTTGANSGFDVITLYDNASMVATATDVSGLVGTISACSLIKASDTYIVAFSVDDTLDNITVLKSDNLTGWESVYNLGTADADITANISLAAPNGTGDVWVAVDDATNVDLYHSDNGTSGNLIRVYTLASHDLGGIVHDGGAAGSGIIAIGVDISNTSAKIDFYYE